MFAYRGWQAFQPVTAQRFAQLSEVGAAGGMGVANVERTSHRVNSLVAWQKASASAASAAAAAAAADLLLLQVAVAQEGCVQVYVQVQVQVLALQTHTHTHTQTHMQLAAGS